MPNSYFKDRILTDSIGFESCFIAINGSLPVPIYDTELSGYDEVVQMD